MTNRPNGPFHAAALYLLRAGVFLLIGPFVGGIANQAWLMRIGYFYDSPLDLLFDSIIVIFGVYVLGWKAALATGLVMGLLCTLIRWQPVSLAASVVVGGAAGAWLIGPTLWITRYEPDWHEATLSAIAGLFSTWVLYHDRYLRPQRGSRGETR